jgi:hypothetical protein
MPRTAEDIETYLMQLDRRFELDNGTYLLTSGPNVPPIAVRVVPPIVAVRVVIGPVPTDDAHKIKLFTRLLEYNATDLMHASYGIEDNTVVLAAGLALDNLDKNELEVTLSDIDIALAQHIPTLHDAAMT